MIDADVEGDADGNHNAADEGYGGIAAARQQIKCDTGEYLTDEGQDGLTECRYFRYGNVIQDDGCDAQHAAQIDPDVRDGSDFGHTSGSNTPDHRDQENNREADQVIDQRTLHGTCFFCQSGIDGTGHDYEYTAENRYDYGDDTGQNRVICHDAYTGQGEENPDQGGFTEGMLFHAEQSQTVNQQRQERLPQKPQRYDTGHADFAVGKIVGECRNHTECTAQIHPPGGMTKEPCFFVLTADAAKKSGKCDADDMNDDCSDKYTIDLRQTAVD